MPFGATTPEADPAKALAVRQAIADLIDRDAISEDVYKGTFTPLYSYVPEGLTGATESLKGLYGDGNGAPDPAKAAERMEAAGITTPPLDISIQYVAERYGPSSSDEYAIIKENLEESGLFTVDLQSTEWVQFSKDRVADLYPAYQLGWFPPDYSDADNYLTPFFLRENFLANHYDNPRGQRPHPRAGRHSRRRCSDRPHRGDPGQGRGRPLHDPLHAGCAGRRRGHGRAGSGGHARRVVQVPLRRTLQG